VAAGHCALDVFSRKVVGWAFGERQTDDLVLAALNQNSPTNVERNAHCVKRQARRCHRCGRTPHNPA
jgi:transposase InsO family protein